MSDQPTTATAEEREYIIVGQDTGTSYRLWDVAPAPTDPTKRAIALEEIGVDMMDALSEVHLEHATTARQAVDQLLATLRDTSGLDEYPLTDDSNMKAYEAPTPAPTPENEPYGRAETLSAAHGVAYHVSANSVPGLPAFNVDGLPDTYTAEVRDRVRAAILNSGIAWPQSNVLVKLTPMGPNRGGGGSSLDLAIACAILAAAGYLPPETLDGLVLLGELGLDGSLRPTADAGALAQALAVHGTTAIVPDRLVIEAATKGVYAVIGVASLNEAATMLAGHRHHCAHCDTATGRHEWCTKGPHCLACQPAPGQS